MRHVRWIIFALHMPLLKYCLPFMRKGRSYSEGVLSVQVQYNQCQCGGYGRRHQSEDARRRQKKMSLCFEISFHCWSDYLQIDYSEDSLRTDPVECSYQTYCCAHPSGHWSPSHSTCWIHHSSTIVTWMHLHPFVCLKQQSLYIPIERHACAGSLGFTSGDIEFHLKPVNNRKTDHTVLQ